MKTPSIYRAATMLLILKKAATTLPVLKKTAQRLSFRNRKNAPVAGPGWSKERGQTLVEFALSLTITLMLIFGLIDFSRAVYTASVVQWSAQQGARAGTVDPSQVQAAVEGRLVGLNLANLTVAPPQIANNIITVQVSYTFNFMTPIITPFAPAGIEMQGEASMLIR